MEARPKAYPTEHKSRILFCSGGGRVGLHYRGFRASMTGQDALQNDARISEWQDRPGEKRTRCDFNEVVILFLCHSYRCEG
jgi:hypothetical protein